MDQPRENQAKKVSIVIPTLNEAGNVDALLTDVLRCAGDERDVEIIIVDDGSTDGTREKVLDWSAKRPVRLVARDNERGLTGAVLAGAAVAQAEIILVMDADLSHPPSAIPSLIQPIADGQADMVIGSRYIPGGGCEGWPAKRKIMSRGAAMMAWPLTDVKDPLAGFFAVRKDKILAIDQGREGFKISLEILMRWRDTLRVAERPIAFKDRTCGSSKLGSKVMVNYLNRLAAHAGGVFATGLIGRFIVATLLAAVVDAAALAILGGQGIWYGSGHLVSIAVGLLIALPIYWFWVFCGKFRRPGAGPIIDYAVLATAAAFLRGGLLDVLAGKWGLPVVASACASWLVLAVVIYAGLAFWVFSPTIRGLSAPSRWTTASVGIIAFMLLIRLAYLGGPELIPEEAYYCSYAAHPDIGYLDHPPMAAWLIWAGTHAFGVNEFAVRFPAFLCWLVAGGFIFAVTRNLFGKPAGLRAAMLMSILPYFVGNGLLMTPDCPLVACWAGAIYFLERAILAGRKSAWLGVGIFMGLGLLSKYTIVLLGLAALVAVLLDKRARKALASWQIWTAVLIAIALFSPVIIWNAQHDWASFRFQTTRRGDTPTSFNTHMLLLYALIQLFPTGLAAAIHCLAVKPGPVVQADSNVPDSRPDDKSVRIFLLALTLVPLAVFLYFSIRHEVQPNWTGPIWLAVLPFIAHRMALPADIPAGKADRIMQRCWGPTLAVLVLLLAGTAHYITLGLPKIPFPADQDKLAMNDLARQVAAVADDIRQRTGKMPVIVGMDKYQAASELAFYVPLYGRYKSEEYKFASNSMIFDESSLMWDFWANCDELNGRTFVMANPLPKDPEPLLKEYFNRLDPRPPQKIDLRLNGKFVRNYYIQTGENYNAAAHKQFIESSKESKKAIGK
ncbi:MAG: glycosyltransferase family 39 protein [Planctomycetes bacterium]|nr:glycosyltransferase family 39 protein [Planctomycetota bacterium]